MSNKVVPLKVWKRYSVSFNRSTDYTFRVLATSKEEARHIVLSTLDDHDMETMNEMLSGKSPTYTNILSIEEN